MRYSFTFREGFSGSDQSLQELNAATGGQAFGAGSRVHTVVGGDTLWAIAGRYGVKLADVIAANPWLKNPNLIHVGDKVVIPS